VKLITKREAALVILAAIVISAILFGTSFYLDTRGGTFTPAPTHLNETIIVKETEMISFQREGDWVLATFLDGTICIHDKREIEPVCRRAVKEPTI
jgi:hypothetical protein